MQFLQEQSVQVLRNFGDWDNQFNVPEEWEEASKEDCIAYWVEQYPNHSDILECRELFTRFQLAFYGKAW